VYTPDSTGKYENAIECPGACYRHGQPTEYRESPSNEDRRLIVVRRSKQVNEFRGVARNTRIDK